MNEAALKDFGTILAAAAAQPGGSSKLEPRSGVHDAKYKPFAAPVNGLSGCPHHVSCNHMLIAQMAVGVLCTWVTASDPSVTVAGGASHWCWSPRPDRNVAQSDAPGP
jgi:hypothetical protein